LDTTTFKPPRDLRLAALQESPHAFWAKLSDERRYSREQLTSFLGGVAWFVERRDNNPAVGIAGWLQEVGPEWPPDGPTIGRSRQQTIVETPIVRVPSDGHSGDGYP